MKFQFHCGSPVGALVLIATAFGGCASTSGLGDARSLRDAVDLVAAERTISMAVVSASSGRVYLLGRAVAPKYVMGAVNAAIAAPRAPLDGEGRLTCALKLLPRVRLIL